MPREDEPRFRTWADAVAEAFDPDDGDPPSGSAGASRCHAELGQYFGELADARRGQPGDDLISGLVTYDGPDGRMSPRRAMTNAACC